MSEMFDATDVDTSSMSPDAWRDIEAQTPRTIDPYYAGMPPGAQGVIRVVSARPSERHISGAEWAAESHVDYSGQLPPDDIEVFFLGNDSTRLTYYDPVE